MTKGVTPDVKTGIPSIISDDNGMPVFHLQLKRKITTSYAGEVQNL